MKFNLKKNVKTQNYMQIFIYTPTIEESLFVKRIGEIIYLKNFVFKYYKDYVKGTINRFTSSFGVFNANPKTGKQIIFKNLNYFTFAYIFCKYFSGNQRNYQCQRHYQYNHNKYARIWVGNPKISYKYSSNISSTHT